MPGRLYRQTVDLVALNLPHQLSKLVIVRMLQTPGSSFRQLAEEAVNHHYEHFIHPLFHTQKGE